MIKGILLFSSMLILTMLMNVSTIGNIDKTEPHKKVISTEAQKEIDAMNKIITLKLHKAEKIEEQATLLSQQEGTEIQHAALLEEARLERLMTLKYKAAIACRLR